MTKDHSRDAGRIGILLTVVLVILTSARLQVCASEAGTSNYLPGFQDTLAGVLPPPGTYLKQYFLYYQGTVSRTVAEGRIQADAKLRTPASLSVFSHVTKSKVLGSNYAFGLLIPVLKARLSGTIESPGPVRSFDKSMTGLGDIVISPIVLGWHNGRSHTLAQFAVYVPTGNYNVQRFVNSGLNRWAIEFDYWYTFLDPKTGVEVDLAPGYTIPFVNSDTDYTSGQEFHLDFAALKRFPNKLAAGLTGYAWQQVTSDSGSGARLGPIKGRVFGLGPLVTYDALVGDAIITLTAKYITEFGTKYRFQGNSGWLELAVAL
ncbi:MAG: transporter [Armatimonadota bacterium]|nr:transporter [bacterium]